MPRPAPWRSARWTALAAPRRRGCGWASPTWPGCWPASASPTTAPRPGPPPPRIAALTRGAAEAESGRIAARLGAREPVALLWPAAAGRDAGAGPRRGRPRRAGCRRRVARACATRRWSPWPRRMRWRRCSAPRPAGWPRPPAPPAPARPLRARRPRCRPAPRCGRARARPGRASCWPRCPRRHGPAMREAVAPFLHAAPPAPVALPAPAQPVPKPAPMLRRHAGDHPARHRRRPPRGAAHGRGCRGQAAGDRLHPVQGRRRLSQPDGRLRAGGLARPAAWRAAGRLCRGLRLYPLRPGRGWWRATRRSAARPRCWTGPSAGWRWTISAGATCRSPRRRIARRIRSGSAAEQAPLLPLDLPRAAPAPAGSPRGRPAAPCAWSG